MHRFLPSLRASTCVLVACALSACARAGSAPAVGRSGAGEGKGGVSTASRASGSQEEGASALAPPDGRWLHDAEGREYFVHRIALPPGTYRWMNAEKNRARLPHGLEADVVAHDSESLSIKIYRSEEDSEAPPPAPRPTPDPDELARAYRVDAKEGDGLRITRLDQGLPQRGQWRNGFDVADVDGDGHQDIVFGPPRKSRRPPTVFRGNGAGQWAIWEAARFPAIPFDYGDAAVADLNGDGLADVVLASHLRGIVATTGDGQGGFTPWTQGIEFVLPGGKEPEPAFASRTIEIVDWNRDGRPDVLALGEGPQLAVGKGSPAMRKGSRGSVVYLNGGDGTWTKVARQGSGSFGASLAVADFDGDGRADFAAGSDRVGSRAILNLAEADGGWREVDVVDLRPDALHRAVASADFDRDGRADLAVSFVAKEGAVPRSGIDVLLARGAGWQRKTVAVEENLAGVPALATGDLDGDGAPDVVGVTGEGKLLAVRGDGRGGFVREPIEGDAPSSGCPGYGLRLKNLDASAGDEVIVSFAGEAGENPLRGGSPCPAEGSLNALRLGSD